MLVHIFRSHVTFVHVLRMSCLLKFFGYQCILRQFSSSFSSFFTVKQKWEIFKSIFPFARSFQTPKQAKNFEGSILIHWLVTDLISMKKSRYANFTAGCFLCQESLDLCESWARWKCHLDLVHMLRPPPLDGEAKYRRLWGRIYHSHWPKSSKSTTRVEGGTDLVVVVLFERSLQISTADGQQDSGMNGMQLAIQNGEGKDIWIRKVYRSYQFRPGHVWCNSRTSQIYSWFQKMSRDTQTMGSNSFESHIMSQ